MLKAVPVVPDDKMCGGLSGYQQIDLWRRDTSGRLYGQVLVGSFSPLQGAFNIVFHLRLVQSCDFSLPFWPLIMCTEVKVYISEV